MQEELKHVQEHTEECPPSPVSFYDMGSVSPKKPKARRRKKGLPKYVKYKTLEETDMEKLTPRQQVLMLKKRGMYADPVQQSLPLAFSPVPSLEKTELSTLCASVQDTINASQEIVPVKKEYAVLDKSEHFGIDFLCENQFISMSASSSPTQAQEDGSSSARIVSRAASLCAGSAAPNTKASFVEASQRAERLHTEQRSTPIKKKIYPKTYKELVSLLEKEVSLHTCPLRKLLATLFMQVSQISAVKTEHAHKRNPHALKQFSSVFYNITQTRHFCCVFK
ncbi:hypothetical protein NECID01_1278 [Nematocida sp. AWRm77]|nr:hypothetical protein NECID01_1278 [Nematocida sp. AWRm77]